MAKDAPLSPGLYVVATPIGNLGDLAPRAREVLAAAHTIAAEDTRMTRRLGLAGQAVVVALTEHNVIARAPALIAIARENVLALTSDAGTPAIADPGARLVELAHAEGVPVFAVAGPSALAAALSVAGFQLGEARFLGFLPHRAGAREAVLAKHRGCDAVLVLFEAPTRLAATLDAIAALLDDPETVVCRELTKRFEETVRGRAAELARHFGGEVRGECVIVVRVPASPEVTDLAEVAAYMAEMQRAGARRGPAATEAARRFGVSRNDAYRFWDVSSREG